MMNWFTYTIPYRKFEQEVQILKQLEGKNHTIKLRDAFETSGTQCYGSS